MPSPPPPPATFGKKIVGAFGVLLMVALLAGSALASFYTIEGNYDEEEEFNWARFAITVVLVGAAVGGYLVWSS